MHIGLQVIKTPIIISVLSYVFVAKRFLLYNKVLFNFLKPEEHAV